MLPPLEKHRVADELEPRGECEFRVIELLLELLRRNVCGRLDFIQVDVKVDVRLDEEDVVDCTMTLPLVTLLRRWGCHKQWDSLSCSPHWPLLGAL